VSTGLNIIKGNIIERMDCVLMARVVRGIDSALLATGNISGCHLKVYDLSAQTPSTNVFTGSSPGTGVITGIDTGPEWTVDSTGFNFQYTLKNATIAGGFEGGHTYRAQFYLDKAIILTGAHTGTFASGDTVTGGTSGAAGVWVSSSAGVSVTVMPTAASAAAGTYYTAGETITGTPSTATATVSSVLYDPVFVVFELACDGILT